MTSKNLSIIKTLIKEKYDSLGYFPINEARTKKVSIVTPDTADAAGKAFELHVAKHVGHILNGEIGHPDDYHPHHFSDESGDPPHVSLAKQAKKLGEHINAKVDRDARRMAHHIVNHIIKHTGADLHGENPKPKVYWTSKPKDLERLTGKKGVKSTSDIVIHHGKTYSGISLKYSNSGTSPSLRSPGIEDLTKHLKADHGHVQHIMKTHDSEVDMHVGKLVGSGSKKIKHQNFKTLMKTGGTARVAANKALDASKSAHRKLADHFSDSFNKLDHHEKTSFIRRMIDAEEQPTIKPYRASYDGAKGISKISNPTHDFDKIHRDTHHFESHTVGASVNIHAVMKNGERKKVCSFGIKNKSSSPYSSFAGRVGDVSSKASIKKNIVRIMKKKK